MTDYKDYSGLEGTGYESRQPTAPEDEFFHSIYISGKTRKNHLGINEEAGKLQIRGVEYNLNDLNLIITHSKSVLVKETTTGNVTRTECFSFQPGNQVWKGMSGRTCGRTSAERAADPYCSLCKSQIILTGLYCDSVGKPIKKEGNNNPIYAFLRGKGVKYNNVSSYLNEMANLDLEPIFKPITEESKKFEKTVVNNKRFVTNISMGETTTKYGIQKVFNFTKSVQLPDDIALKILQISKKTLENFNEKFDWGRSKKSVSGYGDASPDQKFDVPKLDKEKEAATKPSASSFSFEDAEF